MGRGGIGRLGRWLTARRRWLLYQRKDYLDAYRKETDERVAEDPKTAIGGMWEEIGRLQFEFLVRDGLQPSQRMLDIGCGTLRGGRHFIRYLEPGGYTGFEISAEAIRAGEKLVEEEGLAAKRPRLVLNESLRLTFAELGGERFDVLLAQSVFTHLKPDHVEECFAHLPSVLKPTAAFYFTFTETDAYAERDLKNFSYPRAFFDELAKRHGYALEDRSADYPHPRGQRMLRLSRSASAGASDGA